jgi:hypothetical protein
MTRQVAADSLGQFYKTDRAVARDAAVQAWAAALVNPRGGNLRKITAGGNAVTTRAALYELVGSVLYATLAHGTAHLQVRVCVCGGGGGGTRCGVCCCSKSCMQSLFLPAFSAESALRAALCIRVQASCTLQSRH